MLGDTLTFTVGGAGGTARTLSKINQDAYASEYLYRSSTEEIRMRVRHTKESPNKNGVSLDRHNVEVTNTVFATVTSAECVRQAYFVLRVAPGDDAAAARSLFLGLTYWASSPTMDKVIGWES